MKKIFTILLCCFFLVGCGSNSSSQEDVLSYRDEDGIFVTESEGFVHKVLTKENIPYDKMEYDGEFFSLIKISLWEEKSPSGHGYQPYVLVGFDFRNLSESNYYWLLKDQEDISPLKTFQIDVDISSPQNGLKDEDMEFILSDYDEEKGAWVFSLYEEFKYDFSDAELTCCVIVEQSETYSIIMDESGEEKEANKQFWYIWDIDSAYEDTKTKE